MERARRPLAELPVGKLSALFEGLRKPGASRSERSATAAKFWDDVDRAYAFDRVAGASSILSLLRVFFPARDTGRSFGLKGRTLAKLLVAALGLSDVPGSDGHALRHWGHPEATDVSVCPLAVTVRRVIERRSLASVRAAPSTLTLGELNALLDELAQPKKPEDVRKRVLLRLFAHARPTSADAFFLTCVLLKLPWGGETELKIVLEALRAGAYTRSLTFESMCARAICADAAEPFGFGIYAPTAQPTRATTPLHVWDKLAGSPGFRGDALIETKVDGWRLQLHVCAGGALHVFTHSGRARSAQLKEHAAYFARVGAQLRAALRHQGGARGSILDCEVVVVNDGLVEPFGSVNALRGASAAEASGRRHHRLIVLDLLMDDGEQLLGRPLRERRARLVALVPAPNDWVQLSDGVEASWQSDGRGFCGEPLPHAPRECPIRSAMARATALAREGIVVKSLDSPYTPGEGCGWVKYKRCATEGLADELHLAIVGLCYGSGKNARRLSRCVLAARETEGEGAEGAQRYRRICETGCGLSRQLITRLERHFGAHATLAARERPDAPPPAWCAGRSWRRHRTDLLLCDAACALVVDVVVSELYPTGRRGGGCSHLGFSLRFPRVVRMRDERDVSAVHSMAELRALFRSSRLYVETWPQPPPQHGAPPSDSDSDSDSDGGESDDEPHAADDDADDADDDDDDDDGAPADAQARPAAAAAACETVAQRSARILAQLRETDLAYARRHGRPLYGPRLDSPASSAQPSCERTPQAKRARLEGAPACAEPAGSDLAPAPARPLADLEIGLALPPSEPVRNRRWAECTFCLDTYSICEARRALLAPRIRALGASVVEHLDEESRWRVTHVVVDGRQTWAKRMHLIRKLLRAVHAGERHPLWTFFDEQLFSEEALAFATAADGADAPAAAEWQRRCTAQLRWTSACPALASLDASCFED